jgi:predicted MFS family arabinose efflux permease
MSGKLSFNDTRKMLANGPFAAYILGNLASHIGDWAQRLAVGWLVWEMTKSPGWLGVIFFSDLAPTLLLSPVGGALADRIDRLKLARITLALAMLNPAVLSVLYFSGLLTVWWLLAAAIYLGVVNAFGQATRVALMAMLVAEEDIPRAAPISSITFNIARFAGPALFGVISSRTDVGYAMLVNLSAYLLFFLVLLSIRPRTEAHSRRGGRGGLGSDIVEGFRYALTHPAVGPLLIVLLVSSLGTRAFMDLLPGFAGGIFGKGPEALAILTGAVGLGALSGAIYLTLRPTVMGLATISMFASAWVGACLILFSLQESFWPAVINLFFAGCGLSVSAVGVLSILQTVVRGEMRGRAISIYGIIFRGGPALGALIMGQVAEFTGLRWPVAAGGVICVLAWFWVTGRLKRVNANINRTVEQGEKV